MDTKFEMSQDQIKQITEESIGVVELSDDMLALVSGGLISPETRVQDSCIPAGSHRFCP